MLVERNPFSRPLSEKQLEANRRNARKSTGPASASGRAISSQNSRKHKLLPFENPALPAQLTAQYYGRFVPANSNERRLVNTLIYSDRIRRCLLSLETRIRDEEIDRSMDRSMADALASASRLLMMIPYQWDAAECAYHNALRQLEAIRAKAA